MAAELKLIRTAGEEALIERFPALKTSLPGGAAVLKMRESAFDLLSRRGLPHRRVEEWKYTDLRALMREAAPPAAPLASAEASAAIERATAFGAIEALRITLVNGHVAQVDSDPAKVPAGLEILPLGLALSSNHELLAQMGAVVPGAGDNGAYALNTAFMADGAVIRVAAGASIETPIHLRFVNTGAVAFSTATRVLVAVGEGASVTLIESHEGPDGVAYQPNGVLELVVGDRAKVRHVRLNREGRDALALSTIAARLGAKASFDTVNMVVGAGVSRHQVYLTFAGDHSTANVNGAAMLNGSQHADSTLLVDHAALNGVSRELFKTVIDDEGTGVFQGKIVVRPQAQKTDGRMMSACLLLSEGGTMNNKPELEIFADDVQCGHGATCGALDDNLLFYLMARGLPRKTAEMLLVQAFLGEAIEAVEHEGAREALIEIVSDWLKARG